MVEREYCSIHLDNIDWNDTSCQITYGPLPPKLLLSIQAVGLIEPPPSVSPRRMGRETPSTARTSLGFLSHPCFRAKKMAFSGSFAEAVDWLPARQSVWTR